jgi:hypothetical protein
MGRARALRMPGAQEALAHAAAEARREAAKRHETAASGTLYPANSPPKER